jgi:hypothetical protein
MRAKTPDFIGIGAQKAGTSWIHACLYEHPQIYMPPEKELHFFSRHYSKGFAWYEEHFAKCPEGRLAGEFSPTYLYDPEAPQRMHAHLPDVKLIVCLRDPVERAVSAYRYAIKMGTIPPSVTFDEVVRTRPAYVEHGFYHAQLTRYLKFFDKAQLLITIYEEISEDPARFIRDVYHFLGVDPGYHPSMLDRKVNASLGAARSTKLDQLMRGVATRLRRAGLGGLAWAIARSKPVEFLNRVNRYSPADNVVSASRRKEMQTLFSTEVTALEQLIGRDLQKVWF